MNRLLEKFRDVWRNRHTLGDEDKNRQLSAFLPAALEIQETPPNPLTRWLAKSIMVLLIIAIVWAVVGKVNIVASAEGKILPGARVKVIQPLQKGVIKKILVAEGDRVRQGEPLVELDGTITAADENRLFKELNNAKSMLLVNERLLNYLNEKEAADSKDQEIEEKSSDRDRAQPYDELLQEKRRQFEARRSTLLSAKEAAQAEYRATRIEVEKLEKTLPIIEKRAEIIKGLFKKQYATETEYLQLEQERIEQTHQLAGEKAHLRQLKASRKQAQQQIDSLVAETKAAVLAEITEKRREIAALKQELVKAKETNQRQILYAPVSGRIQELAITTQGGVVTEAQPLMKIVPDEESLIVEVFVENKDIGFVEKAMPAEIKIHTFPFTKYGVLEAEVVNISDDAIFDEQRGLTYSMLLAMNRKSIDIDGKAVQLLPGMEVTAELKTGERRLVEFFLAPLMRHGRESLRER